MCDGCVKSPKIGQFFRKPGGHHLNEAAIRLKKGSRESSNHDDILFAL
jgi:hypothetical protein